MSIDKRDIEKDSDYPALNIPNFEAKIPEHLMNDLSDDIKFMLQQSSIQSQSLEWLCKATLDTNVQVRKTNGRLKSVEGWKERLSSSWTILAGILIVVGSGLTSIYYVFRMIIGL